MMNKKSLLLALVSVTVFSVGHLEALQRPPAERRIRFPQQRERMEREIEARFDQMLMNRLDLNAEEAAEVRFILQVTRDDRRALAKKEQRTQQFVMNCVRSSMGEGWEGVEMQWVDSEICEKDSAGVIQEMIDMRAEESLLFKREMEAVMEIIDHKQILIMIGMREQFKSHADRIRSEESKRRRGGGKSNEKELDGPS
jgi:hypothetical protein